jgi:cobalt-zinc-cadmium efflux system membrane fusion protein
MLVAAVVVLLALASGCAKPESGEPEKASAATNAQAIVELTSNQLASIKIGPVGTFQFPFEKEAVGSVSFDDDLSVQVFPPYQGKIIATFVELGDEVQKGQPLYSIDSPDLIQAESTLIGAAAALELTSKELARARELSETNGISQRELEQATSDQQTAEGSLKAARDAVRVFGKTEEEIEQIISTRKIDPALIVRSPIAGQVTAKEAPPGLLAQPGNPPAPCAVADVSVKWLLGNVTESDSPSFHVGQPVSVTVMARPGRAFEGKIAKIYPAVDAGTHRVTIRAEIADPTHELRPGMLANFVIRVGEPVEALAIPANGVVRNGDGTMAAWVTTDRKHFSQRIITIGLQTDGQYQVLAGLQKGELAVINGAVFLSNMLQAPPSD